VWTDALRAARELVPDVALIRDPAPADELVAGAYTEAPTVRAAHVTEGTLLRALRVSGTPEVRFRGFLDGIQRARIVGHRAGAPVVWGLVGAAVRVRRGRRLATWGHLPPRVEERLYVPWAHLPGAHRARAGQYEVVDTTSGASPVSAHPGALRALAFERVRADRENAERALAERWCALEREPLFVDGSLTGSCVLAGAPCVVGVIKSHATLHVDGDALGTVMGLRSGERTSVFIVEHPRRPSVASWYLRLRDPAGRDAMFGLVRIEIAISADDVTARADEVSRWVLAEGSPLALPDGRWDRMAYGIRDCEEFLRAVAS